MVHNMLSKELDLKDRWLGIKQLKKKYQPIPYVFKTEDGRRRNYHNRAEAAAEELARVWRLRKEKMGGQKREANPLDLQKMWDGTFRKNKGGRKKRG